MNIKKSLYLSLVRSQLTYCSQLLFPSKIQDIILLERVQRRAAKYILNNYNFLQIKTYSSQYFTSNVLLTIIFCLNVLIIHVIQLMY